VADLRGRRGCQAAAEFRKIEVPIALVNLDGVAAAHGDVGLRFSLKINEFAAHASAACGIARGTNGLEAARPDVEGNQAAVKSLGPSRKDFDRFGGLNRSDDARGGVQDTGRIASGFGAERFMFVGAFEQACQAGGFSRTNRHGDAIASESRSVNPGNAAGDGGVI